MKLSHYFFLIIGLLSLGTASVSMGSYWYRPGTEYHLTIHSSFKRSEKVWGTYDLYSESAQFKGQRKHHHIDSLPISNLILKKGQAFFIRPIQENDGNSRYKVSSFPYRNQKRKKKMYIDINEKKDNLYQLYRQQIESFLQDKTNRGDIRVAKSNHVKFGKLFCSKKWKKIKCQIPVSVRI